MLDSNTVSYLLREREPTLLHFAAAARSGAQFFLSPVVDHEVGRYLILKGAQKLLRRFERLRALWTPVPFATQHWRAASDLWAERHRVGKPLSDFDLLIAVSCRTAAAALVTTNTRHFDALDLPLVDWSVPPGTPV
jgi:tRNA(fMet)-specific endonuclease VapC